MRLTWLLIARPMPVSDFNDYRTLALGIVDHAQFGYPEPTSFFLPVHPAFLAIFAVFSRADVWLSMSTVLVSTASVLLIYLAATKVVGSERGALVAAAVFALFPTFVLFSPVLATEHLFVALMLGAIVALTRLDSRPTVNAAIAGGLLGLAALTRGEAVFYFPAALLFIWAGRQLIDTRRKTMATVLLLGAAAIVVVPWYVRNAAVVDPDSGLSSSAGLNFYFAHNDSGNYGAFSEGSPLLGLPASEASALGWELGIAHIRQDPLNLVRDVWTGTERLFASPDYAVFWTTREAGSRGDPNFYTRSVRFTSVSGESARIATVLLFSTAALSVLVWRTWRYELAFLIVPLAVSSWVLRTVIYWAKPRYAYFITVMAVIVAAVTIEALLSASRPKEPA